MQTCKLYLFTWSNEGGVLRPMCPSHPKVGAHVEKTVDDQVMVTCPEQGTHLLNMCSLKDFESERSEAQSLMTKYGS